MTGFSKIFVALAALMMLLIVAPVRAHDIDQSGAFGEPITLNALGNAAAGIEVVKITKRSLPTEITVPGKIEVVPSKDFEQHAPLSGRISSVTVSLGQMVKEGQVLAWVESPEMNSLAAQLLQSRLDMDSEIIKQQAALDEEVHQAQERYELADSNYKRMQKLHEARIAAQKDVLQAQSEFQLAGTRVKTAKQNREVTMKTLKARVDLTLSPLRQRLRMLGVEESEIEEMLKDQKTLTQVPVEAARSGFITAVFASPGKSIDPSVKLFSVADLSTVWATANVYEDEMSRMRVGQKVRVRIRALQNTEFDGRLTFVGTQVDPQTRTLPVRSELTNSNYKLKPDMYAELFIETSDSTPMVTVPKEAVVQHGGHNIVFVQADQGYQPISVKLGATVGNLVEVEDGLQPGQLVVSRGAFQLGAELLKNSGGEALFAQPTEGERMDEEEAKPAGSQLNLSIQTVIVIVGVAFLLGFGIAAIFLLRSKSGLHAPSVSLERSSTRSEGDDHGDETAVEPPSSEPASPVKTKGGKRGNV